MLRAVVVLDFPSQPQYVTSLKSLFSAFAELKGKILQICGKSNFTFYCECAVRETKSYSMKRRNM